MAESTKERLVEAASDLLDAGGQAAVTLRAVAEAVGVSHNAPYRHFRDRNALLAAVAERDFVFLRRAFEADVDGSGAARPLLRAAAGALIAYGRHHPARYRLLFSDPELASTGGAMEAAALAAFRAFDDLVQRCGFDHGTPSVRLTGLIYAAVHGAIDLELGGRARDAKGLGSVTATADLLFDLIEGSFT